MQQQNPAEIFKNEITKNLRETVFEEEINNQLKVLFISALGKESLASMECDYETFVELFSVFKEENISLYHLSFFINMMQRKSMDDLNYTTVEDYLAVQKQINDLSEEWNKIVKPIKNRISRKIQAKANMGGRILSPTSKHNLKKLN